MTVKTFKNEKYLNFSEPTCAAAQRLAIKEVESQMGRTEKMYLAGKWVEGDKGVSINYNPANLNEKIGHFPQASTKQAYQTLESASKIFLHWSRISAEKRAQYLFDMAAIIRRRRLEINAWMIKEAGKNYAEADAELAEGIDFLEYYALQALRLSKGMPVIDNSWGDKNKTVYLPIGCGISISPWNFPFAIFLGTAFAPISTGCCVISKPSGYTPKIALLVAEIAEEAGLPEGVFNVIIGNNKQVGQALVEHPHIRFINFTGSQKVGLLLAELTSKKIHSNQKHIKRMISELGGKNAMIIDEDADEDLASEAIVQAAFGYQGQKCSACSRVIVLKSIYDKILENVTQRTRSLAIGNPTDNHPIGPVINKTSYDKIINYIKIGQSEGSLITGGHKVEGEYGYYIEPTIFANVNPNSRIAQEEIFGPVTSFIKVDNLDQALQVANDTDYGLTGGYFSQDPAHIEKVLDEFYVGNLYINRKCTGALVGAQPFGGFKMSGTDSKAGGADYLNYFVEAKSLTQRSIRGQEYYPLHTYKFDRK